MWFLTENTEHGLFPPSIPGINMAPLKLRIANGFPTLTAKGKKNDSE